MNELKEGIKMDDKNLAHITQMILLNMWWYLLIKL